MFGFANSSSKNRSRYRSKRSVAKTNSGSNFGIKNWTRTKIALVGCATLVLATTTFLPIILVEQTTSGSGGGGHNTRGAAGKPPQSLHGLLEKSRELESRYKRNSKQLWNKAKDSIAEHAGIDIHHRHDGQVHPPNDGGAGNVNNNLDHHHAISDVDSVEDPDVGREVINSNDAAGHGHGDGHVQGELPGAEAKANVAAGANVDSKNDQVLARGYAGLPMEQTPALIGAKRGHIECDVDVDDMVYWNNPQGKRDQDFKTPFQAPPNYYITFEPDAGGWNNIRMSMEIFFVLAAATGRTLVLPPKSPFYLLGHGKKYARSYGDFFPVEDSEFLKSVNVITMEEFFEREGKTILKLSDEEYKKLKPLSAECLHNNSEEDCEHLFKVLRPIGKQPDLEAGKSCFIFDVDAFNGKEISEDTKARVKRFCGTATSGGEFRQPTYYDQEFHNTQLIHWDAWNPTHRVMTHFYTFLYFTDPVIDNYFKRFVRDFLHYIDQIYCAAGKIVHALNKEGPWSSLHVRRGELQYKVVKFPAEEWWNNTKELWNKDEILFIATDERNKTFFDPIKKNRQVRFLDDYFEMAKLGDLDPYYLGMVDTIVASHGRVFAGTFFSTFTGYINRLRGYVGHSMRNSWYSYLPRKWIMQEWIYPIGNLYPREWPLAWDGIDGDEIIEHEFEPIPGSLGEGIEVVEKLVRKKEEPASAAKPQSKPEAAKEQSKPDAVKPDIKLSDVQTDEDFRGKTVARGLAGRPTSETPALDGASRGYIECDINVDSLVYWNDPQGKRDKEFLSPFRAQHEEKYITFTVDRGGWNNVRMSMEIIFVIAAVTGRTLVLPPKEPLYRLSADQVNKFRGFADFFPLHTEQFGKRVKIISTEEFVNREGGPDGKAPVPETMRGKVLHSVAQCDKREKSPSWCGHIANYLADVAYPAEFGVQDHCLIFDEDTYKGGSASTENKATINTFCGERQRTYWTSELQDHPVIHFRAGEKKYRLLTHFYAFIHFTDPAIDNYYKRFVRDFLHYHDQIYCAAGKVVKALQSEAIQHGWPVDSSGAGGYSAMHIRRGEFQYKKVKIPAEEWYENTKEIWKQNELIYIATDERNKTFFDPIAKHHSVRFLDDYMDLAGLRDLDPNYFGMIDTIIASRGRAFAGTWFSTFTGYINRMRGYHGLTMKDSWYSFLERKTRLHEWDNPAKSAYAWEWPDGWIGIDADSRPSKDVF